MKINEWLKQIRLKSGMTLTELQIKTGINHGQLSRIETGVSELTLFSLVKIMHAFKLSWSSLFSEGLIEGKLRDLAVYKNLDTDHPVLECLNFNDVDLLVNSSIIKTKKFSQIIANLVKMYLANYGTRLSKSDLQIIMKDLYKGLGNIPPFDVYIPPAERREPVNIDLSFELPKTEVPPNRLSEIYLSGGVIIMQDISFFIKSLRLEKEVSLREQAKAINLTHPALIAFETRLSDKVKVTDMTNLDMFLNLKGSLFVFSWRAAEFYVGTTQIEALRTRNVIPRSKEEIQSIEKLIFLSRLFLYRFPNDFEWLHWFRKQNLSGFRDL